MEECNCAMHVAFKGWFLLVFGILLILNAMFAIVSWIMFAGIIAILIGIVALIASGNRNCCKIKKK